MDAALRVLGWQAGQATMMRTLTATTDLAAPAPVVAAPVVAAPAVAVPAVAAPPPQYATHVTLVWSDVENSIEHSLQSNVQHSLTAARKKLRLIDFHVTVEQHGQADVRNPRWFSNTGHWINLPAHGAAPTQADAVIADGRAIMAALGN
jgi:hypothetical protein